MKDPINKEEIVSYITDNGHVTGLTHNFYNYPARFSPQFTRSIISAFTNPGDVVLDPFMGGGTSIVEAISCGRRAIGIDINELAYFITKVKTTLISENEKNRFIEQSYHIIEQTNIFEKPSILDEGINYTKLRNLDSKETWRLKKLISLLKKSSNNLSSNSRNLFKCALLKVSQWSIDNKDNVPTLNQFREKLLSTILEFSTSIDELKKSIDDNSISLTDYLLLNRSVIGIEKEKRIKKYCPPKLVITSPPYPGVHILYHRWQIRGRKETSAPYWIADLQDGHGASFYTFGNRQQRELKDYFSTQYKAFNSIKKILNKDSLVVQLIAFPYPEWQLPKYLEIMSKIGFQEIDFLNNPSANSNRIWRDVPNRKWYAQKNGSTGSSKEVVLFHKLS